MMCPTLHFSADDFELLAEKCAELVGRLIRSSSAPYPPKTQPSAAATTGRKTDAQVRRHRRQDGQLRRLCRRPRPRAQRRLPDHPPVWRVDAGACAVPPLVALALPWRGSRKQRGSSYCSGAGQSPAPRAALTQLSRDVPNARLVAQVDRSHLVDTAKRDAKASQV